MDKMDSATIQSSLQNPSKWTPELIREYRTYVQPLLDSLEKTKSSKQHIEKQSALFGPFLVKVPQIVSKLSASMKENTQLASLFLVEVGYHSIRLLESIKSHLKLKPFDVDKISYMVALRLFENKCFSEAEALCWDIFRSFKNLHSEKTKPTTKRKSAANQKENNPSGAEEHLSDTKPHGSNQSSQFSNALVDATILNEHHALFFGSAICLTSCLTERKFEQELTDISEGIIQTISLLSQQEREQYRKYIESIQKVLTRAVYKLDANTSHQQIASIQLKASRLQQAMAGQETQVSVESLCKVLNTFHETGCKTLDDEYWTSLKVYAKKFSTMKLVGRTFSHDEQFYTLSGLSCFLLYHKIGDAKMTKNIASVVPIQEWMESISAVKSILKLGSVSLANSEQGNMRIIKEIQANISWINSDVSLEAADGFYFSDHPAPLLLMKLMKQIDEVRKRVRVEKRTVQEQETWVHFLVLLVKLSLWIRTYLNPIPENLICILYPSSQHFRIAIGDILQECSQACVEFYVQTASKQSGGTSISFAKMGFSLLSHWLSYIQQQQPTTKEFRWMASSFYNFGIHLYNNGFFEEAAQPLTHACLLYKICLGSDEALKTGISKRFYFLAHTCLKCGRNQDSLKSSTLGYILRLNELKQEPSCDSDNVADMLMDIMFRSLFELCIANKTDVLVEKWIESLYQHALSASSDEISVNILMDLLEHSVWESSSKNRDILDQIRRSLIHYVRKLISQQLYPILHMRCLLYETHIEKHYAKTPNNKILFDNVQTATQLLQESLAIPKPLQYVFSVMIGALGVSMVDIIDAEYWTENATSVQSEVLSYDELKENLGIAPFNGLASSFKPFLNAMKDFGAYIKQYPNEIKVYLIQYWDFIKYYYQTLWEQTIFHGLTHFSCEISLNFLSLSQFVDASNGHESTKIKGMHLMSLIRCGDIKASSKLVLEIVSDDAWSTNESVTAAVTEHDICKFGVDSRMHLISETFQTLSKKKRKTVSDAWKTAVVGVSLAKALLIKGSIDESHETITTCVRQLLGIFGQTAPSETSGKGLSLEYSTVGHYLLPVSNYAFHETFKECFMLLGRIYELKGRSTESLLYYRYGLDLGIKTSNTYVCISFALRIAGVRTRMKQYQRSCFYLRRVSSSLGNGSMSWYNWTIINRNYVMLMMRTADILLENTHWTEATQIYENLENYLVGIFQANALLSEQIGDRNPPAVKVQKKSGKAIDIVQLNTLLSERVYTVDSSLLTRIKWHKAKAYVHVKDYANAQQTLEDGLAIECDPLTKAFCSFKMAELSFLKLSSDGYLSNTWEYRPLKKQLGVLGSSGKKGYRQARTPKKTQTTIMSVEQVQIQFLGSYELFSRMNLTKVVSRLLSFLSCTYGRLDTVACSYYQQMSFFLGHRLLQAERLSRNEGDSNICTMPVSLDNPLDHGGSVLDVAVSKLSQLSLVDESPEAIQNTPTTKMKTSKDISGVMGGALPTSAGLSDSQSDEIKSIIPDDWTVCSLSISPDSKALIACRLTKSRPTLVWNVPFPLTTSSSYQSLMNEFQTLMDESKETIQNSGSCDGEEHRSAWWKKRTAQNDKLQKLLESIENDWFGPWKGIFLGIESSHLGSSPPDSSDSCADIVEYIRVVQGSSTHLNESQIEDAVEQISNAGVYDYATVSRMIRQAHSDKTEELPPLQAKPPTRKKATTRKAGTISEAHISYDDANTRSQGKPAESAKRGPVILILDEALHQIPWESLPILASTLQPITRLPSWAFLTALLEKNESRYTRPIPRPRTVGYVLDPAGDLTRTRENFQPLFESQKEWRGFIGQAPKSEECRNLLETCDAYIYCGHNAGEQFLSGQDMRHMNRCCPTLLIGCSSGALKLCGVMEPKGAVLDYLLAGCPAIVANLWDVTDRDIDRFGKHLIEQQFIAGVTGSTTDLATGVQAARKECRMRFIIGAAPVYYGLPLQWHD